MYALEYCEHLYSAQTPKKSDVQHHGIKGMHWDERRFQNLDGSLTPEGRVRYGVGMSREEMAEARAAEEARQRDIDYNRSKSIREMDDYELQNAVNRSRMEQQFEANMMQRSNNFLQSKVMEEKLNQEYDELMYQKSRVKAERFMQRTERLGQFIGNLAYNYGRIQDVKGKIEDVRAKKALADKNEWQAEQEHAKADKERWNYDKSRGEYERSLAERLASAKKDLSEAKADLDSGKSKKELKAEAKAEKKAEKEAKKSGKDPEYIRKEGDTYIYDDKTKAGWESTKEKSKGLIGRALERRKAKKEEKTEAKREELRSQAKREIAGKQVDSSSALNSYLGGKDNRKGLEYSTYKDKEKAMYENSPGWKRKVDNEAAHKVEMAKQRRIEENLRTNNNSVYKTFGDNSNSSANSKYDWSKAMAMSPNYNGGKKITEAAWKRRKHIKHSEEE